MSTPDAELAELHDTIAELEEFLLHLPDAMVEIDLATLTIVSTNWMARLHTRNDLDKPLVGATIFDFLDASVIERARTLITDSVRQARALQPFARIADPPVPELIFKRSDGTTFVAECEGHFMLNDAGVPEHLVVLFRDITMRKQAERERQELLEQLQAAVSNATTLRGMLPICAVCKSVRDDRGYWTQIESYLRRHAGTDFSHGLCPSCRVEVYPDLSGEEAPS